MKYAKIKLKIIVDSVCSSTYIHDVLIEIMMIKFAHVHEHIPVML